MDRDAQGRPGAGGLISSALQPIAARLRQAFGVSTSPTARISNAAPTCTQMTHRLLYNARNP
jgi:hypothetical protein